jgi:ubiquinone/menaquinone biosynthesis C-methylase UbiE
MLPPNLRDYRFKITSAGQQSPPSLSSRVISFIRDGVWRASKPRKSLSILDVGCGLGSQMARIKSTLPHVFSRIEAIDWSPATVEKLQSDASSVYDAVTLCGSDKLPFREGEFDIALSMENLEHLYGQRSIDSIKEMARVARHVVITTPLPQDCINLGFLYPEAMEAILDQVPISQREFICLESAIHKSTLFPKSMARAGFVVKATNHGHYFAKSSGIQFDSIQCLGIEEFEHFGRSDNDDEAITIRDYKGAYLRLLGESASLAQNILKHPCYEPPGIGRKIRNKVSQMPRQASTVIYRLAPSQTKPRLKKAYQLVRSRF